MASNRFILDEMALTGKVALVTGGNRGLGFEIALAYSEAGAEVAIFARDAARTEEAAKAIKERTGRDALKCRGDVRSEEDVKRAVDSVCERFGRLDILVNNAGINIRKPVDVFPPEEWRSVIETNLVGPFLCCHYAVPVMKKQGWGRIINLGSMLGHVGLPGRTAYCASKGGLHLVTKALALELATSGITVNAIAPGPFLTEINAFAKDNPDVNRFFVDRIPMQRWGEPREVAGVAVFLASEASSFVTGSVFSVDGGWTSQ